MRFYFLFLMIQSWLVLKLMIIILWNGVILKFIYLRLIQLWIVYLTNLFILFILRNIIFDTRLVLYFSLNNFILIFIITLLLICLILFIRLFLFCYLRFIKLSLVISNLNRFIFDLWIILVFHVLFFYIYNLN